MSRICRLNSINKKFYTKLYSGKVVGKKIQRPGPRMEDNIKIGIK
jgi:hypothetical protein